MNMHARTFNNFMLEIDQGFPTLVRMGQHILVKDAISPSSFLALERDKTQRRRPQMIILLKTHYS